MPVLQGGRFLMSEVPLYVGHRGVAFSYERDTPCSSGSGGMPPNGPEDGAEAGVSTTLKL